MTTAEQTVFERPTTEAARKENGKIPKGKVVDDPNVSVGKCMIDGEPIKVKMALLPVANSVRQTSDGEMGTCSECGTFVKLSAKGFVTAHNVRNVSNKSVGLTEDDGEATVGPAVNTTLETSGTLPNQTAMVQGPSMPPVEPKREGKDGKPRNGTMRGNLGGTRKDKGDERARHRGNVTIIGGAYGWLTYDQVGELSRSERRRYFDKVARNRKRGVKSTPVKRTTTDGKRHADVVAEIAEQRVKASVSQPDHVCESGRKRVGAGAVTPAIGNPTMITEGEFELYGRVRHVWRCCGTAVVHHLANEDDAVGYCKTYRLEDLAAVPDGTMILIPCIGADWSL